MKKKLRWTNNYFIAYLLSQGERSEPWVVEKMNVRPRARGQQGAEGGGPRLACVCVYGNSSHASRPSPLKFSG